METKRFIYGPSWGRRDFTVTPWEVLEHTADIGLRVEADTLEEAIAQVIEGFGRLVCPEGEIDPAEPWQLQVEADALDNLLVDTLDEINYIHQTQRFLPGRCEVILDRIDETDRYRATIRMRGETYDEAKHGHLMEIKATTYHGLEMQEDPPLIEVIFDV